MALDGTLLARARDKKEAIRTRSLAEQTRRREQARKTIPGLRELEGKIAAVMRELIAQTAGEAGRSPQQLQEESLALQAERTRLLAAHGLTPEQLDDPWDCPDCRDSGYINGKPCACLRRLYEAERTRELSSMLSTGPESFGSFDLSYYSAVPDPVSGVSAYEIMRTVYETCWDYAMRFGPGSPNLLFRGGTGLGKTFLSSCIASVVSSNGHSVVYDGVTAILDAYEKEHFSRSPDEAREAAARIRRLTGCELLIMDDLGTEMTTEFTRSALYTLVNTRLMNGGRTIISTNLTPEELQQRYTPQLCSRLAGDYMELLFHGQDVRRLRKDRSLE